MRAGDRVQLKVAFNDSWSSGFEIAEVVDGGFEVRRCSDGRILPTPTGADDIRPDERGSLDHPSRHLG